MAKGIEKGVEVFTTEGPRHVTWVKTHLYRCAVGQRHVVDDLFGGCWLETCCATRAKDRRILEAPDVTVWVRAKKRRRNRNEKEREETGILLLDGRAFLLSGLQRPGTAGVVTLHGQAYSKTKASIYLSPAIEYADPRHAFTSLARRHRFTINEVLRP